MRLKFEKEYKSFNLEYHVNDVLDDSDDDIFLETLNDKYYMLIKDGLRYDIPKEYVTIVE